MAVHIPHILFVMNSSFRELLSTIYRFLEFWQLHILIFPMPIVSIVMLLIIKLRLVLAIFCSVVDHVAIVNNFLGKIAAAIVWLKIVIGAISLIVLYRYLRVKVTTFNRLFFEWICLPDAIDDFLILILKLLNPLLELLKLLGKVGLLVPAYIHCVFGFLFLLINAILHQLYKLYSSKIGLINHLSNHVSNHNNYIREIHGLFSYRLRLSDLKYKGRSLESQSFR